MTNVQRIIRWALTLLLIRAVYVEAGIWTALSVFLLFVANEITSYVVARWSWVLAAMEHLIKAQGEHDSSEDPPKSI